MFSLVFCVNNKTFAIFAPPNIFIMKRFIVLLTICCLSFATVNADDDVKVVISTSKSTNYVLYPAITGVFLRLDTRDGTIQAIVPSNPKKNRVLNAEPLALDKKPGRFEIKDKQMIL